MPRLNKVRSSIAVLLATATLASAADAVVATPDLANDVQLKAMWDELQRSKTLQLNSLEKPYFISFSSNDAELFSAASSLGGLVGSSRSRFRVPQVIVRVGSAAFDNTDSVFSGRPRVGALPLDDDYSALRTNLWLATDALYKNALEQISQKRTIAREISSPDQTPDFAPTPTVHIVRPNSELHVKDAEWNDTLRRLSKQFLAHPAVLTSSVNVLAEASTYRLVNTEGSVIRIPQDIVKLEIRATGIADDGQPVWNHAILTALRLSDLPDQAHLSALVDQVASETDALAKAPLAEEYSGPVLFEGEAGAELMAELMADAARLVRKPLAPPNANDGAMLESVWASRKGTKVTPEWLNIVDDPTETKFEGKPLAGNYEVDDEGVPAKRVVVVDKGVLTGFLLSRQPVRNLNGSNGHGRLPGQFGAQLATIGNLFVSSSQPVHESEMKARLLERVKTAGLKYGIIIRRIDFPSTASGESMQALVTHLQKNGIVRTVTMPVLSYRLYADGHEELIRGVRFKEFSSKDLRDLDAASDKPYVLNYLNNGSQLNMSGVGSDATTSSVVCPSLLFDSVDLDRAQDEIGKPPVVPPPALSASK